MYDHINDNEKWEDLMQNCGIIEFAKKKKKENTCAHRSMRVR